ncbi:hypothetical protein NC796_26270, partial [Aliifodinibius sp. S!AR15-10]
RFSSLSWVYSCISNTNITRLAEDLRGAPLRSSYVLHLLLELRERKKKLAQNRQERKYSLKRSYYFPNQNLTIWHIHGELFDSRNIIKSTKHYHEKSIMIGYEHYSSYLKQIQDNIRGQSGTQNIEKQSLNARLNNEEKSPFWTDILFTHNIDIIGLGLDFSENHLWWLINHRANKIRKLNSNEDTKINNKIEFYYPRLNGENKKDESDSLEELIKRKNKIQKSKAIAEVLNAFEVEPMEIRCNSYQDFYKKLTNTYLLS